MLRNEHHTEAIIAVRIAIRIIEIEGTRIAIIVIATTFEKRIARVREIGVRYSLIPTFSMFHPYFSLFACYNLCRDKGDKVQGNQSAKERAPHGSH